MKCATTPAYSSVGSRPGGHGLRADARSRRRAPLAAKRPSRAMARFASLPLCRRFTHSVGEVEADAEEVPEQGVKARHVFCRQRRAQDRGDVSLEVVGAAGAE